MVERLSGSNFMGQTGERMVVVLLETIYPLPVSKDIGLVLSKINGYYLFTEGKLMAFPYFNFN